MSRYDDSYRVWPSVTVYRDGDSLVIVGQPDDTEDAHNCDYMGCGFAQTHVIGRATLSRADAQPVVAPAPAPIALHFAGIVADAEDAQW